ncbi:GNAT family N-acetyltransferase [Pedobacter xixiisoli]|uniref:ElaA protein n=1 Tax=Pedobacter xixiisoli TaxID=1476464 RepID=A0A285ZZM1_9SPHI|nr:GNAT family N-acetyltransferase [Pedobacter xixiisoli]SOD15106.1 ElaA protein [Pedobacter xixiisoli]
MQLQFIIKPFQELSVDELYQILKLRNEVFIVEQNCPYLDLDEKDQKGLHLVGYEGNNIAVYTRLLPKGISYADVSIGRVITAKAYRSLGLGKVLMQQSIKACHESFGQAPIRISAQYHLVKFYGSLGFEALGNPYDEDGIPHIEMLLS